MPNCIKIHHHSQIKYIILIKYVSYKFTKIPLNSLLNWGLHEVKSEL